ncbi:MAG: asparagine synthase (glutamine-hydrolyzing) [Clostridia bacterium]|nr:asparagine synthase (glutamine-hydrolyzing) [Clostridia bacterium]MDD4387262.1 asparagine synthase (glutamine-hydrolyzing) [Clostridia bacterium]
MCGIVGFTNFKKKIENKDNLLQRMTEKITRRGENETGYYWANNVLLGHKRLSIIDINGGSQPMTFKKGNKTYTIVYNGEIYNYDEVRKILIDNDIELVTRCDTEMVIKLYMLYGDKFLKSLNGIFAFCIYEESENKLFLARDHIGVKPLFYTIHDDELFFASEMKSIFEYDKIPRVIDKAGICELFGLGPARNLGSGVFKDIHEMKPGHYGIFESGKIEIQQYFKVKSYKHTDNLETTINKIRSLLETSIKGQLIADVNVGAFLSGGVDSSIVTAVIGKNLTDNNKLKTFSVDYVDNDINFKKTDFTPSRDNEFIEMMKERYNLNHKYIVIDSSKLYDRLYDAMRARDLPSMADIDSSLLLLCENVKEDVTVALSGEFADEIFCGYPWFYRKDTLESNTFPWSISLDLRKDILNKDISSKIDLQSYVDTKYKEAVDDIPLDGTDNESDIQMKKSSYLTMNYFGLNLLDRTDRMSMQNSLEVRVPFTDYELVEYVYNIPWDMKNYMNQEKGILRAAFKDILPEAIINRKKSPYPKTCDPKYTNLVTNKLKEIVNNGNNRIQELVDMEHVNYIINASDDEFTRPWFGQLMGRTQLMAYLIQLEMWLVEYNVKIVL